MTFWASSVGSHARTLTQRLFKNLASYGVGWRYGLGGHGDPQLCETSQDSGSLLPLSMSSWFEALDSPKSQNDCYGDLSNFSKLHVFGSICYALQLQSFFVSWRKDQQKDSFLGSTCWLQSLEPTKKVKVLDGKFLSTEENQIHGLCREEEPSHSLQWPRERVSTANFTHARML